MSYTVLVCGSAMKIDSANAQPMGSLIFEGGHKPFHALACPPEAGFGADQQESLTTNNAVARPGLMQAGGLLNP